MSRRYDWYRHHAWGGLGILSLFSALHALVSIPPWITFPVGGVLTVYIAVNLFRTYRSSGELRETKEPVPASANGGDADKVQAKAEKKRLKADAKREKKAGGEK